MSQRITIEIKDKIATCLTELPVVCGNSDYVVDFVFDEEWNAHEVKTAIFVVNGKAIPQVFAGNVCPIPVIQNTLIAWVGVFAGTVDDGTLSTSTPALVKCVPCITDGDNVPAPPPDDVYNQIIGLINAGMLRGETGEKGEKGDKGDAGSIKFLPVVELPTENIDESAIYLVPLATEDEQNRFTEYVYIDGKWETIGAITVQVDHSEYVKFTDFDEQTIESLTDNARTLTDEEKAAACGTIGAAKVASNIDSIPSYATTMYVRKPDGTITMVFIDTSQGLSTRKVGNNEYIYVSQASNEDIDKRTHFKAITGFNVEYAIMSALADCKNTTIWTEEKKASARALLGVDDLIAELRAEIAALKGE